MVLFMDDSGMERRAGDPPCTHRPVIRAELVGVRGCAQGLRSMARAGEVVDMLTAIERGGAACGTPSNHQPDVCDLPQRW